MEFTKPMDISPFRSEIHPPHSTASFGSVRSLPSGPTPPFILDVSSQKDEKVHAEAPQKQTYYKPYNPWIAFFQVANAASPPYTQHAERPSYNLLSASGQVQNMIGLQMEQAAEQLRKAGIYQAEHGQQAHDQIGEALKGPEKARQNTHNCAWKAPQDAGRRADCAASNFSASQFFVEESVDSYTYTMSDANGDLSAVISRHSYPRNGASYSGPLPGDTDLPHLGETGTSKVKRHRNDA